MNAQPAGLRLFVAIELPQDVLTALAAVQDALRRRGLEKLRWVRPEGIHLTLKFLGETAATRVPEIAEAVSGAAAAHVPHALSLGALGTFGSRSNPRVLWVDAEGEVAALKALQVSVDTALAPLGFPKEDRPFSPHLTLARVRPETARDVAAPLAEALAATSAPVGTIDIHEVSLMQSTLGRGGAVYNRLGAFPLAR